MDTGEVVMASTIYSCGPAALATIFKALGIYTTEAELAERAGTDESGTSLLGLKEAADWYGVSAAAVRLTVDQLKANYLVVLDIEGTNHFEVILNITDTTVYLFDPNLGNIEMSLGKFNELYTGVAMIFNEAAPAGAVNLTPAEMEEIKASGYIKIPHFYVVRPGYWYYTYHYVSFSLPVPYIYNVWVSPNKFLGFINIPGHWEPRIGIRWVTRGYYIPIPHYVPPKIGLYYTYIRTPDLIPNLSSSKKSKKELNEIATRQEKLLNENPVGEVRYRKVGVTWFEDQTPEQQALTRKITQQSANFVKGAGLFGGGIAVIYFGSPLGYISGFFGQLMINRGLTLMAEGTDYI